MICMPSDSASERASATDSSEASTVMLASASIGLREAGNAVLTIHSNRQAWRCGETVPRHNERHAMRQTKTHRRSLLTSKRYGQVPLLPTALLGIVGPREQPHHLRIQQMGVDVDHGDRFPLDT